MQHLNTAAMKSQPSLDVFRAHGKCRLILFMLKFIHTYYILLMYAQFVDTVIQLRINF